MATPARAQIPKTDAPAEPGDGMPPALPIVPDPGAIGAAPAILPKQEPPEIDRVARLERSMVDFAEGVSRQISAMAHVIDRLASAPTAIGEVEPPGPRMRSDERLADVADDFSDEELLRMLELKGAGAEVARLRAEGIDPEKHYMAADCMVLGLLDPTDPTKLIPTKVMPGDPIDRARLSGATLQWSKDHPEGLKLVRPGEYRAPKTTPAHTR